jgi:hypothetical protein
MAAEKLTIVIVPEPPPPAPGEAWPTCPRCRRRPSWSRTKDSRLCTACIEQSWVESGMVRPKDSSITVTYLN